MPYEEKSDHFFELFNECFIMFMNYHLMCFADFILDEPTRDYMGFSMIAFVSFNFFVNISYIIYCEGRASIRRLQIRYYKWKRAKL